MTDMINSKDDSELGPVKNKIIHSLEDLLKQRKINAGMDDVEITEIARVTTMAPILSGQDIYMNIGELARELIKPTSDIFKKINLEKLKPDYLIPILPKITVIGKRCLVSKGILGEENIGNYSLSIIGRNSYNASADILFSLRDNKSLIRLINQGMALIDGDTEQSNDLEKTLNYYRIFANRFNEYARILQNAGLMVMTKTTARDEKTGFFYLKFDINDANKQKEKTAARTEDELIEELGLPSKNSFFSMIEAARMYEDNLEYKHDVIIKNYGTDELTKIDLYPKLYLSLKSDDINPYYENAIYGLKRALFLINSFYNDNGIKIDELSKTKPIIYDDESLSLLKDDMESQVNHIYEKELLSKRQGRFWHFANENRIRAMKSLLLDMKDDIEKYESRVPLKELAISSHEYEDFNFSPTDGRQITELIKFSTLSILKGIETRLFEIPEYKKGKSTENVREKIAEDVQQIRDYVNFISHFEGFFYDAKEELMSASISSLTRDVFREDLVDRICKDSFKMTRELSRKVLIAHSLIRDQPINKDMIFKLWGTGENTDFYFQLAQYVMNESEGIANYNQLPKDKIAYTGNIRESIQDLTIIKRTDKKTRYTEKELVDNIVSFVKNDDNFKRLIHDTTDPFSYLADTLNLLGIPEVLAYNIESGLKDEIGKEIHISSKGRKDKETSENSARIIVEEKEDIYALLEACMSIYNKVSSIKIDELLYSRFHKNSDRMNLAWTQHAIEVIGKKDGKREELYSKMVPKGMEHLFEDVKSMFPENDIYFGPIGGVAMSFEGAKGGNVRERGSGLFRSEPSVFQLYMGNEKTFEDTISHAKTKFHEMTHCSHSGLRHNWRRFMAVFSEIILDYTIKKYEQNIADNIPFFSSNFIRVNTDIISKSSEMRLNYKDIAISILDDFSKVALGVGNRAESMRKKGFYEGSGKMPFEISPGFYKVRKSDVDGIPIEKSNIAGLVADAFSAINNDDLPKIRGLKEKFKDYSEEMCAIEEHSAEVMSLLCTQYMLNELGREYPENKKYYSNVSKMIEQEFVAIAEITKKSLEILNSSEDNPREIEKMLNSIGMTYKRVINYYEDMVSLSSRFQDLGISKMGIHNALNNFDNFRARIKSSGNNDESAFYLPVNEARTFVNERYRMRIPDMLNIYRMMGDSAWDMIFNSENIDKLLPDTGSSILIKN